MIIDDFLSCINYDRSLWRIMVDSTGARVDFLGFGVWLLTISAVFSSVENELWEGVFLDDSRKGILNNEFSRCSS